MAAQLPAARPSPPQPAPRMPSRSRSRTGSHQMCGPARSWRAAELRWCPTGMGGERATRRATEASWGGGGGAQQAEHLELCTGMHTHGARLLSCAASVGVGWCHGRGSSSPPPTIAPARLHPTSPLPHYQPPACDPPSHSTWFVAQLAGVVDSEDVSEPLAYKAQSGGGERRRAADAQGASVCHTRRVAALCHPGRDALCHTCD